MNLALTAIVGMLLGVFASNLASQALHDSPLRPHAGTCPRCGTHKALSDWRCPQCGRGAGREVVVALTTGAMAVGVFSVLGVLWTLIPYTGFVLLTTALCLTDIDAMRIVDRLNLRGSAILIGLLGLTALLDDRLPDFLLGLGGGAAYFAGALLLFLLVRGNGFGAGDVKLAPLLGVFTGFLGWGVLGRSLVATAVIGGVLAVFALVFMAARRNTELPYGPAMIIGSWLSIVLAGVGT